MSRKKITSIIAKNDSQTNFTAHRRCSIVAPFPNMLNYVNMRFANITTSTYTVNSTNNYGVTIGTYYNLENYYTETTLPQFIIFNHFNMTPYFLSLGQCSSATYNFRRVTNIIYYDIFNARSESQGFIKVPDAINTIYDLGLQGVQWDTTNDNNGRLLNQLMNYNNYNGIFTGDLTRTDYSNWLYAISGICGRGHSGMPAPTSLIGQRYQSYTYYNLHLGVSDVDIEGVQLFTNNLKGGHCWVNSNKVTILTQQATTTSQNNNNDPIVTYNSSYDVAQSLNPVSQTKIDSRVLNDSFPLIRTVKISSTENIISLCYHGRIKDNQGNYPVLSDVPLNFVVFNTITDIAESLNLSTTDSFFDIYLNTQDINLDNLLSSDGVQITSPTEYIYNKFNRVMFNQMITGNDVLFGSEGNTVRLSLQTDEIIDGAKWIYEVVNNNIIEKTVETEVTDLLTRVYIDKADLTSDTIVNLYFVKFDDNDYDFNLKLIEEPNIDYDSPITYPSGDCDVLFSNISLLDTYNMVLHDIEGFDRANDNTIVKGYNTNSLTTTLLNDNKITLKFKTNSSDIKEMESTINTLINLYSKQELRLKIGLFPELFFNAVLESVKGEFKHNYYYIDLELSLLNRSGYVPVDEPIQIESEGTGIFYNPNNVEADYVIKLTGITGFNRLDFADDNGNFSFIFNRTITVEDKLFIDSKENWIIVDGLKVLNSDISLLSDFRQIKGDVRLKNAPDGVGGYLRV